MKKVLNVIASLLLLVGCSGTSGTDISPDRDISHMSNNQYQIVKTPEFEGVIFPEEKAAKVMAFRNVTGFEFWTPSKKDILELEERIIPYLKQNKQLPELWKKVSENRDVYKRQYAGFIVDGRKRIYLNVVWFTDMTNREDQQVMGIDERWKKEPYIVLDGGDHYFQIEYDIKDETFLNLTVNGEA